MAHRNVDLHPNNYLPDNLDKVDFDVVVIGSGPAGRQLAVKTAASGLSTVIIENELFGGDCPFWACIPSKALLRPAEVLNSARMISGAKELVSSVSTVDVQATFARRDKFVQNWQDQFLVDTVAGCSIIRGKGTLSGSEPVIPNIPGLKHFWTPRDATSSSHVPEHLVIIGAGVVGCEMATAYNSFGGKVSLIGKVLPKFEPEAARRVREALLETGVVLFDSKAVEASEDGVKLANGETLQGTVLIATGRKPNWEAVELDETLCAHGWLYVLGDANGRALMTHMGAYQARRAAAALIARTQGEQANGFAAPTSQVVVTDPNVASVGLTLSEAKRKRLKVKEIAVGFNFPGAFVHAEFNYDGWAQWVVDVENEVLVGATFVGREVADLLHASTVAIVGGVKMDTLRHAVPSFPTMSEVYVALLEAWEAKINA